MTSQLKDKLNMTLVQRACNDKEIRLVKTIAGVNMRNQNIITIALPLMGLVLAFLMALYGLNEL